MTRLALGALCLVLSVFGQAQASRAQTPSVPAEIVELARALKGDPDLIYEYVYNNINTLPMYGSIKGALGALLDREGTAFDQAELMVTLLRQSSVTANYVTGSIHLPAAELTAWLGTDTSFWGINSTFALGGFPYGVGTTDGTTSGAVTDVHFGWAWVQVTIGGDDYVFDPATKTINRTTGMGMASIASAISYNQSAFLGNAAAVTTTSPWALTSLDRSNVRNDLATYASRLVQHIRSTNPAAATSDIIGGSTIVPLALGTQQRISTLPHQFSPTVTIYADIPSQFRILLTQQLGSNAANGTFTALSSAITFNSADIYSRRMTVAFSGASVPSLLLDGVTQVTASGTVPAGRQLTVRVSISYPWPTTGGYPSVTNNDDTRILPAANAVHALLASWGSVGRGMIEKHRKTLQQNIATNPGNPTAEPVLGESFAIIGYTYAAERAQHQVILSELGGVVNLNYHLYGTFGMSTRGSVTGPFISIWILAQAYIQRAARPGTQYTPIETNAFIADGFVSSVTESATIEQTQPDAVAVSTVKLIDTAVQQGVRIFDINNNAIPGDTSTYYQSTIRPILQGTWSSGDLSTLDSNLAAGQRVIAPENGSLHLNQYIGVGWHNIDQTFDGFGSLISGGLRGGASAINIPASDIPPSTSWSVFPDSIALYEFLMGASSGNGGANLGAVDSGFDPTNLVTGDYYMTTTDVAVGSRGMPHGLEFQRYYDSGTRLRDGPLGFGWTHNFAITAKVDSDPFGSLAATSPINGAAAIVGTLVALDLANTGVVAGRPLDRFVIGGVIYRWITDQLTSNVVAITQPGYIEHFVKLADGSYNPPPGSAAALTFDGSAFSYIAKDRTTLSFNSDGNLATWTSAAGASMTLNYTGSPQILTSVTNNLGRSLTLTYQSDLLTLVTDDSGRSVSYTYDGASNLTTFVDALGQTTSYVYDVPGRITQLFYPSSPGAAFITNIYDSLSRVQAQTNINGGNWLYFLAGTRSEEVDPFGMRHVIYTTPGGKTRLQIQDWQGPKQTVTINSYDALDRLTQTTAPEGNSTSYTYDLKSNVLSVTQTSKPGSPLSPLVTTTTYDPTFNKPLSVTDPRGLVTTMTYDPWTGNLLSAVADSANLKATTRYTYNSVGLPLSVTDPVGTVTQNAYDGAGNLTSAVRDAGPGRLNLTTAYTYNARGDPITVTDPRGSVATSTYDSGRRLLTATTPATSAAPAGVVTTYTYDPAGRVLQAQQSAGGSILRTTSTTYTPSGKPATVTDANGNVTRFAYDLLDRRIKAIDALGRVTEYGYDTLSRLTQASNPAIQTGPLAQQGFTLNGQRASLTDANSNVTAFTYDGFDRLTTTTWPDASYETLGYDADGNVVSRGTRAGQPIAYAYDTLNRLITKTPPAPWPVVSYSYDLAGRMTSVSDTSAAIRPIATPGSTTAYTTSTTYDALNRPTGVAWDPAPTATAPAAGPVVAFGHSYNAANQRVGETVSDNAWLAYPAATPATTAYTANALNQYTAVGGVTPAYDGNGNLTSDGTSTLGHDPENRLVSASGSGNTAAYAFDPRGRRKVRTVNGTTTITVTGADNRELLDYDGSNGAILRWYAYGSGPNAVLNQMNVAAGTRDTLLPNLLGSIVASVDSVTGNIAPFGYQPYGTTTAAPAQFGYTGQRVDQETGLYYYRARHYSPAWGRFTQADPIGYQGGINLYGYAGNDPINFVDATGLAPDSSMVYSYATGGGSSWGSNLLQGFYDLIPGTHYTALAQGQAAAGSYVGASIYGTAAFFDVTLAMATAGVSSRAMGAVRTATTAAVEAFPLRFAQVTASPMFNTEGNFAGRSIASVASDLRSGTLVPANVPVGYIAREGSNLIVNTRSSLALRQAGIPVSQWNLLNQTGNLRTETNMTNRLLSNRLTNEGTDVLRITGAEGNASRVWP